MTLKRDKLNKNVNLHNTQKIIQNFTNEHETGGEEREAGQQGSREAGRQEGREAGRLNLNADVRTQPPNKARGTEVVAEGHVSGRCIRATDGVVQVTRTPRGTGQQDTGRYTAVGRAAGAKRAGHKSDAPKRSTHFRHFS